MKKVHGFAVKMAFATLCVSLVLLGVSHAHAGTSAFVGSFTLTQPTQWGDALLKPGSYTISIASNTTPTIVVIRDSKDRNVAEFVSGIDNGNTSTRNALFVKEKAGHLQVYSLALASLKRVLIYDTALAREATLEARAPQTLPVILAKR